MRLKANRAGLICRTTTTSDCQIPFGQIPGDKLAGQARVDGYGRKDFGEKRFQDESRKRYEKCQQPVHDRSLAMDDSWVMMIDA